MGMAKPRENRLCVAVSRLPTALFAHKKEVSMAKAATPKATAPTVTLKHLAATLAGNHEIPKKQSETFLGDFVGLVVKHLKKGDRIRIGGLGILQVRKRAARMGRNPATGDPIKIKASKKVAFRAAKELKEAV
jgi:DNA-binding protein HU-beta